jgi:hypothetical protein
MNRAGSLLLFALSITAPTYGGDQAVIVRVVGVQPTSGDVQGTLQARSAAESRPAIDTIVRGTEAAILLPEGQWFVSASYPGYWAAPALVSIPASSPEATIRLYRTTRVRASVTTPARGKTRSVDVHFTPTEAESDLPRSSTACAIADTDLDCEIPSGVYDLAFRIPGHASLYRWGVDLRERPAIALGKLEFRTGSTFSGRVEVANSDRRNDSLEGVQIALRTAGGPNRNDNFRNRQSVTAMTARANRRGFFSFDVLAGQYVVSASYKGLVTEEREVTVVEGREVTLKEPLRLERPWTLVVNVQLPAEGAKQPWNVVVTRFDIEGNASAERVLGVPADGVCRLDGQVPGSYTIEVKLHDSVWAAHSAILDRDTTLDMPVRVTKVRGSIHLGDKPLAAAKLILKSREKALRIPVQVRDDGGFVVFAPVVASDRWDRVEIESERPWVRRVLEDVPLERNEDGLATMEIKLPAIRIDGVVVDDRERPVADGLINISDTKGFRQLDMSNGGFTINGLAPGRYALTAATRSGETEEPLIVDIPSAEEAQHDVVLRVAPVSRVRGTVVSAGGPAMGATLLVAPLDDVHGVFVPIPVDTTGAFSVRLPPKTRDVMTAVAAPGFAFRMMRMTVPSASLDLVVDQNGGVLTIDGTVRAGAEPLRPYLTHNGAVFDVATVAFLARARFLPTADDQRLQFEVSSAEEGAYALCVLSATEAQRARMGAPAPDGRCASGVLTRHGALELHAPDVAESPRKSE